MTAAVGARRRVWKATLVSVRRAAQLTAVIRPLPEFLIVGTQRGGTTSLHRYLSQHPGVLPARLTKGVHWFDAAFDKPESWYRANFPTEVARRRARRRLGYPPVAGESSPYYLFHPHVPARIASVMPDVRLIAVLRDPVARAWSHYQHNVARGMEALSFAAALDAEPERLAGAEQRLADPSHIDLGHRHGSYVARGRYVEQLARYSSHFDDDQMLVLFTEDLDRDPGTALARVHAFLGLPPAPAPTARRWNQQPPAELPDGTRQRLEEAFAGPDRLLAQRLGVEPPWRR